jgi:hypothetical protein
VPARRTPVSQKAVPDPTSSASSGGVSKAATSQPHRARQVAGRLERLMVAWAARRAVSAAAAGGQRILVAGFGERLRERVGVRTWGVAIPARHAQVPDA